MFATKKFSIAGLFISIAIAELVGALSALLSGNSGDMYMTLQQPPFSPPAFVFPIAWGALYAIMGIAAYLVYIADVPKKDRRNALGMYALQLLVNFSWSIVFFRFKAFWLAVVVILLLDILVAITTALFGRIKRASGWLMMICLGWILFATYLAFGIAILN